jgi:hypothetical protein
MDRDWRRIPTMRNEDDIQHFKQRLEANPAVTRCIHCAEKAEG